MRLQKFLAERGIQSRRKCEELIKSGLVFVNDTRAHLGEQIDPDNDVVKVDGKVVEYSPYAYFLFHKPKGYLSTVTDPQKRPTIFDLVKIKGRVFPVGRLDKDSEGLMLLTNDGDLAYALTHPKFQVEKVYEVQVEGIPSTKVLEQIKKGVLLKDGLTSPAQARVLKILEGEKKCWLEIKIHEGRKREIRRMLKTLGHEVISLCRVAIGPLQLSLLPSGEWRTLNEKELKELLKLKSNKTW